VENGNATQFHSHSDRKGSTDLDSEGDGSDFEESNSGEDSDFQDVSFSKKRRRGSKSSTSRKKALSDHAP